jgi:hypothetical protein
MLDEKATPTDPLSTASSPSAVRFPKMQSLLSIGKQTAMTAAHQHETGFVFEGIVVLFSGIAEKERFVHMLLSVFIFLIFV